MKNSIEHNIEEAEAFLFERRIKGSILGMESIRRLCAKLDNPQEYGNIIHIAGTNGKGSTGKLLEAALCAMGFRVGRYSSPAVFCPEEIIQLNGVNISKADYARLLLRIKAACEEIKKEKQELPTAFEVETAAAFLHFKEQQCDFSIIEVGMGGRTDATNVLLHPTACVITSISRDHTGFLGESLSEIAAMKAGIIKPSGVVVKLRQSEEINRVIEKEIEEQQGSTKNLYWAVKENYPVVEHALSGIRVKDGEDTYGTRLSGICQQENLACAITTLKALEDAGKLEFEKNKNRVKEALQKTLWPGRMEVICKHPLCVMDGCHNPDAAVKLKKTIQDLLPGYRIHFVIGVLKDKEYPRIFQEVLPLGVSANCITPPGERGLLAENLAEVAKQYVEEVTCFLKVSDAMEEAFVACTKEKDMVFVFGSLSYLGEVKQYVNGICQSSHKQ